MRDGAFVPSASGDEIEIAPWPQGNTANWIAMAAMRLTMSEDAGPSLCAKILPSITTKRLPKDGPRGLVMIRDADGFYVAPAVPMDANLRNTDDLWARLGQTQRFVAYADVLAGGQVWSGAAVPVDLVLVNRKGFLAPRPEAGPGPGPDGGMMGTPSISLRVGMPGSVIIVVSPGGTTPIHLTLEGQRAGYPVHFEVLSALPAGFHLDLARTDIPAGATDDEALDTLGSLQADASVPVGTKFDLRIKATAGPASSTFPVEVDVFPPQ